jgi:hypothetical protein
MQSVDGFAAVELFASVELLKQVERVESQSSFSSEKPNEKAVQKQQCCPTNLSSAKH